MATLSTTGPLTIYKPAAGDNVKAHETGTGATGYNHANLDNINAAFNATTGHDHDGVDSKQVDHGGLGGLADDDHTQYIKHSLATAENDFLVASGAGVFVKKTLAEAKNLILALPVFLGDTANALNTAGLTINQGAADDEALSLKSSDVAHGITDIAETDTYGALSKIYAAGGGVRLLGLCDIDATAPQAIQLVGLSAAAADTTKSAAGRGIIALLAGVKSGTGWADPGANGNMVSVTRTPGGGTVFILDSDGDSHQDVGTAWTNFHNHDDINLVAALAANVSRLDDPIRATFGQFLFERRADLERLKLVTFNEDGHHFVNMSKLTMLLTGAIQQMGAAMARTEQRLALMEQRLAMLPGG